MMGSLKIKKRFLGKSLIITGASTLGMVRLKDTCHGEIKFTNEDNERLKEVSEEDEIQRVVLPFPRANPPGEMGLHRTFFRKSGTMLVMIVSLWYRNSERMVVDPLTPSTELSNWSLSALIFWNSLTTGVTSRC